MQNLLIAMTCRQFMELIGQSQGSGRHTVWTVNEALRDRNTGVVLAVAFIH